MRRTLCERQFASTYSESGASYKVMTPNDEVLNSWKEVAAYLGRGVRTVQRWEQELGLPVRRPRGKSRSAVIAFKPELDQWLHHAPAERLEAVAHEAPQAPKAPQYFPSERQAKLHENTILLIGQTRQLLSRSSNLCEQLKMLREKLHQTTRVTTLTIQRNAKQLRITLASPDGEAAESAGIEGVLHAAGDRKLTALAG